MRIFIFDLLVLNCLAVEFEISAKHHQTSRLSRQISNSSATLLHLSVWGHGASYHRSSRKGTLLHQSRKGQRTRFAKSANTSNRKPCRVKSKNSLKSIDPEHAA